MSHRPRTDIIAGHALLVGLASAVPVPLLDDALEARAARRLVRALAKAYELELSSDAVVMVAEGERKDLLRGAAKGALLWPLKKLLRKTFIVLGVRAVVVKVSSWIERGLLVDWAFASSWCEPAGPHTAEAVRQAIDEVLAEVPSGPIEEAVRAVLAESRLAAADVSDWLQEQAGRLFSRDEPALDDDGDDDPSVLSSIGSRLARALEDVEDEHFDELREQLTRRLGGSARAERDQGE